MIAFSAARLVGAWSIMAASAPSGTRVLGIVASFSIMPATRADASRTRAGMAADSGMLSQYFLAICWRISFGLLRAGLNVLS